MTDEKELVEKMCAEWHKNYWKNGENAFYSMKSVLSVVKADIWKIAEVCPECRGKGKYYLPHGYCRKCADPDLDCDEHTDNELNCPKCKGLGITMKGKI